MTNASKQLLRAVAAADAAAAAVAVASASVRTAGHSSPAQATEISGSRRRSLSATARRQLLSRCAGCV